MATQDRGAPIAYLALEAGTPVYASGGERLGTVEHVLADSSADIFEGIVLDARGDLGGRRFADAEEIADMYERAVLLRLDRRAAERLPEPKAGSEGVGDKLRRAWDVISGH